MTGTRRHVKLVAEADSGVATSWQSSSSSSNSLLCTDPALRAALEQLESAKVTERVHALQQVSEILTEESQKANGGAILSALDEPAWEHVISWTSRILIKESQGYVNKHGKDESSTASAAAERLGSRIRSQYSGHVRHIWVAAMPYVSGRLAKYMVRHIVKAFREDPCLVQVLGLDYGKVLRAWAMWAPHVVNCGDKLVGDVVELCGWCLSRGFENAEKTSSAETVRPGDVEYAAAIATVVAGCASPARMAKIRQSVIVACAGFLEHYGRENPCHVHIIHTVNAILVAVPEEYVGDRDLEMLVQVLSACLDLWSTRSVHTKQSVLRSIRVLTRIIYCSLTSTGDNSNASAGWAVLELALKTLTTGSWGKFRLMSLPPSLLSLWPMVASDRDNSLQAEQSRAVFEYLHSSMDACQYGFFDTVSFLVVKLLNRADQSQNSGSQGSSSHRRKRARTGLTPLSRLLNTVRSAEDSGVDNARGAAQVVWFIMQRYRGCVTKKHYQECYEAMVEILDGDRTTALAGAVVEWVLGVIRCASKALGAEPRPLQALKDSRQLEVVWRHVVAGIEAELSGAAGLALDMLNQGGSVAKDSDLQRSWYQAAVQALKSCGQVRGDPDYVQLALVLGPWLEISPVQGESDTAGGGVEIISRATSKAVVGLCTRAAQMQWPANLFERVVERALGLGRVPDCWRKQSGQPTGSSPGSVYASGMPVPAAQWAFEMRFMQALLTLDAFAADQRSTARLVESVLASERSSSSIRDVLGCQTTLSAEQWWHVGRRLLAAINETETVQTVPFVAHVVWRAAEFVTIAEQRPGCVDTSLAKVWSGELAKEFLQQISVLSESEENLALVCQVLRLTYGWWPLERSAGVVARVVRSLFAERNAHVLCAVAVGSSASMISTGDSVSDNAEGSIISNSSSYHESLVMAASAISGSSQQSADPRRGHGSFGGAAESRMDCFACGLVPVPWEPLAWMVGEIHSSSLPGESIFGLVTALEEAVVALNDTAFLCASEFIADCIIRLGASAAVVGQQVVERALGFLDRYEHAGSMAVLYSVVLTVSRWILQESPTVAVVGEDVARFVAWVAVESKHGRIGGCVETAFVRLLVGPWSCRGNRQSLAHLAHLEKIIGFGGLEVLADCARQSMRFGARLAAEAEIAAHGLGLKFISGGAIICSNSATDDNDVANESAGEGGVGNRMVTRDVGLALLIVQSQCVVPGALSILLKQAAATVSAVPAGRARGLLCERLLAYIADTVCGTSVASMLSMYASAVLRVDRSAFEGQLPSELTAGNPEFGNRVAADMAVELMLRGEDAQAGDLVACLAPELREYCCQRMAVHALAIAVVDVDRYATVREELLVPRFSSLVLENMLTDGASDLVLQLLMMLDGADTVADLTDSSSLAAMGGICSAFVAESRHHSQQAYTEEHRLPQWGIYYGRTQIVGALEHIAQANGASSVGEYLTGPQICGLVTQLHLQLAHNVRVPYDRQRLLGAFLMLMMDGAVVPDVVVTQCEAVRIAAARLVVGSWLDAGPRGAWIACSAACLLLDRFGSQSTGGSDADSGFGEFACELVAGMADSLLQHREETASTASMDHHAGSELLAAVINAISRAYPSVSAGGSCSFVLLGSVLSDLPLAAAQTDSNSNSSPSNFVVTISSVRESEDRMGLVDIAECAAKYLRLPHYAVSCAEILVECVERLLQLTVPQQDYSLGTISSTSTSSLSSSSLGRLDIVASAVVRLGSVKRAIEKFTAEFVGDRKSSRRRLVVAPLVQAAALLEVFEQQRQQYYPAVSGDAGAMSLPVGDISDDNVGGDDVPWLICRTFRWSPDLDAVCEAINAAVHMDDPVNGLQDRDRRIVECLTAMRSIKRSATMVSSSSSSLSVLPKFSTSFDDAHLVSLCPSSSPFVTVVTARQALSSLVCSLASRPECNGEEYPLALIWADARVAGALLPRVLNRVLVRAGGKGSRGYGASGDHNHHRSEVAGFLLDFAHNWCGDSPQLAREIVARILQVRRLDRKYTDIREFLKLVPLPLFELAALASRLGMPETAVFLLECDLTMTISSSAAVGNGDTSSSSPGLDDLSRDARELMMVSYQSLGNQMAAVRLLSKVNTTADVVRRCWNQGDWRTLLMYQEATATASATRGGLNSSGVDGLRIGSTLVQLGLLNAVVPGSNSNINGSDDYAAGYASAWRLAKWDIPGSPVVANGTTATSTSTALLGVGCGAEETLYNILNLRSHGRTIAAERAAQGLLVRQDTDTSSSSSDGARRATEFLMPLIAGKVLPNRDISATGRIVRSVLDRVVGTNRPSSDLEMLYMMNLALHEINVRDAMTHRQQQRHRLEQHGFEQDRLDGDVLRAFAQYKDSVLQACRVSGRAENWQMAMNHIFRLSSLSSSLAASWLSSVDDEDEDEDEDEERRMADPELRLWEAEVLWESGNRNLAIEILKAHRSEIVDTDDRILLSRVTLTIGEWLDHERVERPKVLWEKYFNKAAVLLQTATISAMPSSSTSPLSSFSSSSSSAAVAAAWTGKALNVLGTFAERQCEELLATIDDETASAVRLQKSNELKACQQAILEASSSGNGGGSELARLKGILRRLEAQVSSDEAEMKTTQTDIGGFLQIAVWAFAQCLEISDSFDNSVYSLVSLIMTHANMPEMGTILLANTPMERIASRKFLPLAHQLCARLSTDETPFHSMLKRLVYRMAVEYPYHVLNHLFALRNANRTSSASSSGGGGKGKGKSESDIMEEKRCRAAEGILMQVRATDSDLKGIVDAVDQMCEAYIELAVSSVPEKYRNTKLVNKIIGFSSKMRISRLLQNLPPNIPVFTARPTTGIPGDYGCVPFISSMSEGYSLAGGINLPKILRMLGSDGQRYKQLVKGKDDMRQDAVIEQLFQVINEFMNPADQLKIRTYMVVPLTKRCGVLQWVDNTMPFGEWFRENEQIYRQGAPTTMQLRGIIHNVHKQKGVTARQKLEAFNRVCEQAPPIFRYFFFSMFYDAQTWFERRSVYIRSAAVSSVAGWVLGIGDRHLQNILIDKSTAELVHIDLGIAFGLGELLPVPELVPFRLTREMVDGMGVLGLDATFRENCRIALAKIRENSRVVITILNVLKVDPLYMWSLIPLRRDKMEEQQQMRTENMYAELLAGRSGRSQSVPLADAAADVDNKEASRSILHVGKLLGANISVEGQINELIQQATNPDLLSRMFEGWSAWY